MLRAVGLAVIFPAGIPDLSSVLPASSLTFGSVGVRRPPAGAAAARRSLGDQAAPQHSVAAPMPDECRSESSMQSARTGHPAPDRDGPGRPVSAPWATSAGEGETTRPGRGRNGAHRAWPVYTRPSSSRSVRLALTGTCNRARRKRSSPNTGCTPPSRRPFSAPSLTGAAGRPHPPYPMVDLRPRYPGGQGLSKVRDAANGRLSFQSRISKGYRLAAGPGRPGARGEGGGKMAPENTTISVRGIAGPSCGVGVRGTSTPAGRERFHRT